MRFYWNSLRIGNKQNLPMRLFIKHEAIMAVTGFGMRYNAKAKLLGKSAIKVLWVNFNILVSSNSLTYILIYLNVCTWTNLTWCILLLCKHLLANFLFLFCRYKYFCNCNWSKVIVIVLEWIDSDQVTTYPYQEIHILLCAQPIKIFCSRWYWIFGIFALSGAMGHGIPWHRAVYFVPKSSARQDFVKIWHGRDSNPYAKKKCFNGKVQ